MFSPRVGAYLREKPNFIKVGAIAAGLPYAFSLLWMFGKHGGIWWWLFLVALASLASWISAIGLWHVLKDDFQQPPSSTGEKTR